MMKLMIFQLTVMITLAGLWCVNAVRLVRCDWEPSYKAEVLYTMGVFTPTCIITAWMDIK